jgi:signal transduction histidine kinase
MQKKMSILAIDDVPLNLDLLTDILDPFYNVSATISGKDALEMLEENIPDLILLDIMMPEMDGYEVCDKIKENKKWEHIPIIFLTAKNETEDIVRAYELGAADYLSKPFNPPELLARVKAHLEIKESRDIIKKQNAEQKELLHVLCHDLANPFASVLSVLDIVDTDNFSEYSDLLKKSAENGMGIIALIRQMRKLEEKPLILDSILLFDSLQESLTMLNNKFKNKNITVKLEVEDQIQIKAEKTSLINSVINNILTNAIKFSHSDGEINITSGKHGEKIVLSIRDHGIGIPKEMLNTLFDVNQSVSRKGTGGEEGTGFGMPLVRKFMSAYGGEIDIESVENEGTAINLTFILA